ncbi:MAG: DNA mismatch endonuclease Vsr [Desulfuromonadaceae bacterium]
MSNRNIPEIMRAVHSRNTLPELLFRKNLWSKGYRYSIHSKKLPGKPDVVLVSHRIAIFIDGDFWHGGQWEKRKLLALEDQFSKSVSKTYWLKKIRKNMHRDCQSTAMLIQNGWTVLRFWESQVIKNVDECVNMTIKAISNNMDVNTRSLFPEKTVAEFFSGIGLMRIGLERQGWNLRFANDIDAQKCQIYRNHFSDADEHLVEGDIHKLDVANIPRVTLATASFPCNDLSLAGARKGLIGEHSSAFWGFVEILEKLGHGKPPLVLLENVTGFLTSHGGADFKDALLALNKLGYMVDSLILDASRFVPQSRQRLFVIGIDQQYLNTEIVREQLQFFESDVRPKALAAFILKHKEIDWYNRPLPPQPQRTTSLINVLEDIPHDSALWWNKERSEYLYNQMSPRHKEIADKMINARVFSYGTVFRRVRNGASMAELRTDGVAGCLRTPRGGSGRQILFKAGSGQYYARLLTPRECARLMGVGEFTINVPQNQALFGFGDAVCVPVVEWIAENYLNPLVNEMMRGKPLYPTYEGEIYGYKKAYA